MTATRTSLPPTITGGKLRRYLRCRRLPFMDAHADPADAVEPALLPFGDRDRDDPEKFVSPGRLVSVRDLVLPSRHTRAAVELPPAATATAAAKATIDEMNKGSREILGGLVSADTWWGAPMRA